jgi:hypothetical protein
VFLTAILYEFVYLVHNEKLYDLYSSPNIIWVIISRSSRWAGHMACIGDSEGAHRVLVGKPEGKRPLRSSMEG